MGMKRTMKVLVIIILTIILRFYYFFKGYSGKIFFFLYEMVWRPLQWTVSFCLEEFVFN